MMFLTTLIFVAIAISSLTAGYAIGAIQYESQLDDLYEDIWDLEDQLANADLEITILRQRPYSTNGKCQNAD